MRSDRNIQRTPKRPVAARTDEAPAKAPIAPDVKVTVKPFSGVDDRYRSRPDQRDRDGGGTYDRRRPPRDAESERYGRGRGDGQGSFSSRDDRRGPGPRSDDRRPPFRDSRDDRDDRRARDDRRPFRRDDDDRRPLRAAGEDRRPFRPGEDRRPMRPAGDDRRPNHGRDDDRRSFRPRDDDERRPFRNREDAGDRPFGDRRPPDRRSDDRFRDDDRRRSARPPKPWEEHAQRRSPAPGNNKPYPGHRDTSKDRRTAERPAPRPERMPQDAPQPDAGPHPDGARLAKVMSDRGLASRREADEWIEAGWVKVDGRMAVLGQRVHEDAVIEIDPAARTQQAKRVTILLHKPIGYVSGQAEDGYEPASVLVSEGNHWEEDPARKPYHPGHSRGLAPAGRLDIDSTGLLVLTQDGRIAKHLIGDDSSVEKEYLVRVEYTQGETLPDSDLELLNHGLELDGFKLRPAKVSWANEDQLRFVLREGRKRQIRRMCELVGLKVLGLKRVRIGRVVLGKLPMGQWRYLRDDELF